MLTQFSKRFLNICRFDSFLVHLPLAHKVSLAFAGLISLTLMTLWLIVNTHLTQLLDQQTDSFGRSISDQMANSAAELVLAEDLLSLNVLVAKIVESGHVVAAIITDMNNQELTRSGDSLLALKADLKSSEVVSRLPFHNPDLGIYISPIVFQDVRAGYVFIAIDKRAIRKGIEDSLKWMTLATIVLLVLGILLAVLIARGITDPIKRLTVASHAIRKGHLDQEIKQTRYDEIGTLIEGFNEMARGLRERNQIRATFKRYMDPAVANNILSNLDSPALPSEYVNASVLFVDIVGYTKMSEQNPPEVVVELLNAYYELILKSASLYRGMVDKFMGDGAMIVFGAPQSCETHALDAASCGLLILNLVAKLNKLRVKSGLPVTEFRAGLHGGAMLAGCLGPMNRLQYTVIGDPVNVAARLCAAGIEGRLVMSKASLGQAGGESTIITGNRYVWTVRGKADQVDVVEVLGLLGINAQLLQDNFKKSYADLVSPLSPEVESFELSEPICVENCGNENETASL